MPQAVRFPPLGITQPVPCTYISFIYHRRYINWVIGSVVKWNNSPSLSVSRAGIFITLCNFCSIALTKLRLAITWLQRDNYSYVPFIRESEGPRFLYSVYTADGDSRKVDVPDRVVWCVQCDERRAGIISAPLNPYHPNCCKQT